MSSVNKKDQIGWGQITACSLQDPTQSTFCYLSWPSPCSGHFPECCHLGTVSMPCAFPPYGSLCPVRSLSSFAAQLGSPSSEELFLPLSPGHTPAPYRRVPWMFPAAVPTGIDGDLSACGLRGSPRGRVQACFTNICIPTASVDICLIESIQILFPTASVIFFKDFYNILKKNPTKLTRWRMENI